MFKNGKHRGRSYRESNSRASTANGRLKKTENGHNGKENGQANTNGLSNEYENIELIRKPSPVKSMISAIHEGLADLVEEFLTQEVYKSAIDELDGSGLAFLHHAARYDQVVVAKVLIESGADLNVRSEEGLTPLHTSIRSDNLDMFTFLLTLDADPSLPDNQGNTVLHHSVKRANVAITEILLDHPKVQIDTKNNAHMTSLHLACNLGNEQISELLISRGADIRAMSGDHVTPLHLAVSSSKLKLVKRLLRIAEAQKIPAALLMSEPDIDGNTAIHLAAHTTDQNIVVTCLRNGAKVNARNGKQESALHVAAAKGILDVVTLLVACGADVVATDSDMRTPLNNAAVQNHVSVVQSLVRSGAKLETADTNYRTPFLAAVAAGKTECAKELIDLGANVQVSDAHKRNCVHLCIENEHLGVLRMLLRMTQSSRCLKVPDVEHRYPIHYAALANDFKILETILAAKPDVSLQDSGQQTPLHLAAAKGLTQHVQALVKYGAGVNKSDDQGRAPLHNAAARGRRKVCAILIEAGADVHHKDNNRWTPLMLAAHAGCRKTCETLIDHQACTRDVTAYGENALSIAMATGHPECVKLLLDRGADFSLACMEAEEQGFNIGSSSVAMAIVCHERWQEVLGSRHDCMEYLIQHFPEAAKVVLDKCIHRSGLPSDPEYTITYDFRFLNPGPDSEQTTTGSPFFAPSVMVEHEREEMLLHPLTKKLIDFKWTTAGRYLYYFFFVWYLFFLVTYTVFVVSEREKQTFGPRIIPGGPGAPGGPGGNKTVKTTTVKRGLKDMFGDKPKGHTLVFQYLVLVFVFAHMLKEIVQMFVQRFRYFTDYSNLTEWTLYITTLFFMIPYLIPLKMLDQLDAKNLLRPDVLWTSGVVSIFLAYVNLILFFRRFRMFGLYVSMFLEVTKTLIHVLIAFFVFILAFAIAFFVLFKEQPSFNTLGRSIMRTTVMMIGEFDYEANFITTIGTKAPSLNPIPDAAFAFLALFLILMSIVLMNLLVGLAVGDIETIRRNARLKRLAMMVDYVADIDSKYPRFFLRWVYKPRLVEKPHQKTLKKHFMKKASLKIRALEETLETADDDKQDNEMHDVTRHVMKNKQRIKSMMAMMEEHNRLLRNLARTLGPECVDWDETAAGEVASARDTREG